jgi:hypothetical protein
VRGPRRRIEEESRTTARDDARTCNHKSPVVRAT